MVLFIDILNLSSHTRYFSLSMAGIYWAVSNVVSGPHPAWTTMSSGNPIYQWETSFRPCQEYSSGHVWREQSWDQATPCMSYCMSLHYTGICCSIMRKTWKGRKETKMEGGQSGTYLRQTRASSGPRVSVAKTYRWNETKINISAISQSTVFFCWGRPLWFGRNIHFCFISICFSDVGQTTLSSVLGKCHSVLFHFCLFRVFINKLSFFFCQNA